MSALSNLIEETQPSQRAATYHELAEQAVRVFDVTTQEVTFLGHNSGVAFRVETSDGARLLLKVHAPQGESEAPSASAILGGLRWLAEMARRTDIPVQTPLPDPTGDMLPPVAFRGLMLHCSLQRWIEGEQVDHLSESQAHAVGVLMGRWHTFAGQHEATSDDPVRHDSSHLHRCLAGLGVLVGDGSIPSDLWGTIEQATAVASSLAEDLGSSPEAFGVIHGDVIPDNILVADDGAVRFIDFAQLAVAPFLWDLGVALYHYSYQERAVRRAMVAGYRTSRPTVVLPRLALEAFICSAALDNLAFQVSIPQRRATNLFHTNVQKFATGYCRDLLAGVPFALE